jgi:MYXO-CTERM domain-containing protein
MPAPSIWPEIIGDDAMPWEEDVEQAVMVGPNQNLSDQTPLINELLTAWNTQNGWPPSGDGDGDGGTTGDGDGTSGDDTSGDGTAGTAGDGTGDAGVDDDGASCACSTREDPRDQIGGMALFGLLGLGLSWRLRQRD